MKYNVFSDLTTDFNYLHLNSYNHPHNLVLKTENKTSSLYFNLNIIAIYKLIYIKSSFEKNEIKASIMSIREKTILFAFPMNTNTSLDATLTNFTQITAYIPENSPTFVSVFVEIGFQDVITASGGRITEHRCALRLGSSAYNTIIETDDIAQSGENISGIIGPFNFTSYFTNNWSGTSMTCDVAFFFDQNSGTTQGMRNTTAILYVTYSYDDNIAINPTQIKTVRIPLESLAGGLTAIPNYNIGTDQIPQLTSGGMLCENSPNIVNYFFLIEANENGMNSGSDFAISVNIDSGTPYSFGTQERQLVSDRFCRWIWHHTTPPNTNVNHNFQMWSSINNRVNHASIDLIITYQFNAVNTTRIINSIQLPIEISSPLGVSTPSEASRFKRDFLISDPGIINLRQSAFRIHYNLTATPTAMFWRAGIQNYRSYVVTGNVVAGMFCLQQRLDSGSSQASGITINRGQNSIIIDGYSTNTTNQVTNIMGYITLNYESDIGSSGCGQNSHTVIKSLYNWDAILSDRLRVNNYSFSIPETNYWLISFGFIFIQWVATAGQAITFDVECLPSEGKGGGYYDVYTDAYQSDAERSCTVVWMRGRDIFKRFPQDIEERLDPETLRDYRLFTSTTTSNGLYAVATYHSFKWTIAGNITGSNGIDNINLKLIRVSDNQIMQTQILPFNATSYSFDVYDNVEEYYVSAIQNFNHLGSSKIGTGA